MELLLDLRAHEVNVTEEVVKIAVQNQRCGLEILELLLERRRDEVKVSQEVVSAVEGFDTIKRAKKMWLLLDRLGDSGSIPDEILKAIPKE